MKHKFGFNVLLAAWIGCSLVAFSPRSLAQKSSPSRKARKPAGAPLPYFLFLSDVHLNADATETTLGDDAGMDLWGSCMQKLRSIVGGPNPPKFIVYTGDLPVHYKCCSPDSTCLVLCSQPLIDQHNAGVERMLDSLGALSKLARIPVLYAPGNNDALAGDYYPFSKTWYKTPFSLVNAAASSGFPYQQFGINKNATRKVPYMLSDEGAASGYWSVRVMDGLRAICLNTVLWGPSIASRISADSLSTLVRAEMAWLTRQLDAARRSGDKVYIAMHIPPGVDAYSGNAMWNTPAGYNIKDVFLGLMEQYRATVTGIFYGHTHYDELRLLYGKDSASVTNVAISCPGVSTSHRNFPAFKTVQFHPVSKMPVDFTTYFHYLDTVSNPAPWGDSSYRFSTLYQSNPNMPIYNRLRSMSVDSIQAAMSRTYKAGNGTSDAGSSGVQVTW